MRPLSSLRRRTSHHDRQAGNQGRKGRIEPGSERPDSDQRIHARRLLPGRLDGAGKKTPVDPEDDGRGQEEGDDQKSPTPLPSLPPFSIGTHRQVCPNFPNNPPAITK